MHSKVDNKLPPVCDKWGKLWFELSHPLFSIWRKSHLEQISTEAAIWFCVLHSCFRFYRGGVGFVW